MPNEPHLLMNYGLELIRSGQAEEGLEQYWEAVHVMAALPTAQIIPELRETLLTQLATQLLAVKDFAGVIKLLELPLAKSAGPTASMHFLLGLALLESKRFAEAAIHFRHCITRRDRPALSPIHKDIRKAAPRHCLALCLKRLQQPADATKIFREALEEEPESRPLRHDFARFLADQQQPVEALQLLFQLVNEKPDDINAWWLGGQIALSRPDFLECARDWTAEAMKQFSTNPQIAAQQATALLFSGNIDEARPLWRELQAAAAPKHQAALALCELLTGGELLVAPDAEPAVSQEFLGWYRQLLTFGASALIEALNARIENLQRVLPSAGRVLQQAVQEAEEESLKAECKP
jgi:tetratricopeptide (TPR) repeat protein